MTHSGVDAVNDKLNISDRLVMSTRHIFISRPVSRPTSELTRRRESKHPPPHQASCETRPRRSRPTICSHADQLQERNATQPNRLAGHERLLFVSAAR